MSELNLRSLVKVNTLFVRNLEHRFLVESKEVGKDVRGECLDSVVELARCRVEVTTYGGQLVLNVGNLGLQLKEVLIGLQVGIGFQRDL